MSESPTAAGEPARPKVQAAIRPIQRASDLFDSCEGKLVAIRALRFDEHTFDEEQGPTTVAEVAVVLLEGDEPRPIGVVGITWRRVIRQLMAAETGTWQVGRLSETADSYKAKELDPPGGDLDLDAIADRLGRFQAASLTEPKQLALSAGESGTEPDDDIPF